MYSVFLIIENYARYITKEANVPLVVVCQRSSPNQHLYTEGAKPSSHI